jgi:hypothetical protein
MSVDENETENVPSLPRLFVFEPGWKIGRKSDSIREFCYQMSPGQDYYHRLMDGEIYLFRSDEKVCLPCAARRGLVSYDPKSLRDPVAGMNLAIDEMLDGFDVVFREEGDGASGSRRG